MAEVLEVLVDGGKATAGPPLGPALGPMGMNIMEIVKAINERTASFEGMKVPVKLVIDTKTKTYTIEIGTPPTSALILKEIGAEKGGGEAGKTRIGNLTLAQAIRIANMKAEVMLAKDLKGRVLEVVGTSLSMGVTIDGKNPTDITADIRAGKYDKVFAKA